MKTVVLEETQPTISLQHTSEHKYYLCVDNDMIRFWVLTRKSEGCIFNSINNRSGHSGYSETIQRSIEVVMKSPSTKHVLEFDTFLELAQYVVRQTNTEL